MRYRAKNDTILEHEGKETLTAKGDKVYVQQYNDRWKVFSFYSRNIVVCCTKDELMEWFCPEDEFQKPPRENKFRGRSFGNKLMTALMLIAPLITTAQMSPVKWSYNAVRVDSNYFEFHLRADIYRGWWIYEPNRQEACPYSPIVTFERSPLMKPIEKLCVIEYAYYADNEEIEGVNPPLCPVPQYKTSVIFVQLFKMPINRLGTVKGQIIYQALGRYVIEPPITEQFSINVGDDSNLVRTNCTAGIATIYPKRTMRKVLWWIRHPFGPSYISKKIVP